MKRKDVLSGQCFAYVGEDGNAHICNSAHDKTFRLPDKWSQAVPVAPSFEKAENEVLLLLPYATHPERVVVLEIRQEEVRVGDIIRGYTQCDGQWSDGRYSDDHWVVTANKDGAIDGYNTKDGKAIPGRSSSRILNRDGRHVHVERLLDVHLDLTRTYSSRRDWSDWSEKAVQTVGGLPVGSVKITMDDDEILRRYEAGMRAEKPAFPKDNLGRPFLSSAHGSKPLTQHEVMRAQILYSAAVSAKVRASAEASEKNDLAQVSTTWDKYDE